MCQQLVIPELPSGAWRPVEDERLQFNRISGYSYSRNEAENFIREAYQKTFGAKVTSFLPDLVTANKPNQPIHLAFGLSSAATTNLFLENYLDKPVENVLSQATNTFVQRSDIAEVGNLALTSSRHFRRDFIEIARYCLDLGYEYMVCTATRLLRLVILNSGIKPIWLANASFEDAPDNGTQWGDYYQFTPMVIASCVRSSLQQLK